MAKKEAQIGVAAFIVGLLIAIVLGIWPTMISQTNTVLILGVLGIIVGLLNVGDKELDRYLMANVAFLLAAGTAASAFSVFLGALPAVGAYLGAMVLNITAFVAPGAAVIALRELYEVAGA